MTFGEFNAWLDGYSASIAEAPTPEQWQTIKAKLAQIVGPFSHVATPPILSPSVCSPIEFHRVTCSGFKGATSLATN